MIHLFLLKTILILSLRYQQLQDESTFITLSYIPLFTKFCYNYSQRSPSQAINVGKDNEIPPF